MFILTGDEKQIVNSEFVERFCISEKPDAALIVASYGESRPPITLSRYSDIVEAKKALYDMILALSGSVSLYRMPDSTYYWRENRTHDARTKRKGGS